jgi:hypothetical protein
MYPHEAGNLRRPAGVLIGCILAVWPSVSASGQSVGLQVSSSAAASSDSQPHAQTNLDRWDESKVSSSATDAGRATGTAPATAPVEAREFAQHYIAEKVILWQQRLKLNEWKISWTMACRSDLKLDTVGQIHWDEPGKSAAILVLDPSDYHMPFDAMLDDMELTIVHELVHLKLTSLPHSEASRGSEEQAVNGISEALFALDHRKQ